MRRGVARGHALVGCQAVIRAVMEADRDTPAELLEAICFIGDPIGLTDDKKGYRCAFKLVPDDSHEYAKMVAEHAD